MMGIDIHERVRDALSAAGIRDVTAGRITAATAQDGVVVRLMPTVTTARYMDGSRRCDCYFQVIAKGRRSDGAEAPADVCERAIGVLRDATLESANGSFSLVSRPEPDGDVEELAVGGDRTYVFAVKFVCKIIRKG